MFDSFEALQAAVYDLRMSGFSRHDISLLGGEDALEEKLGSAFWRSEELEDNPDAVIGTLLAWRVGQKHKDYYADQICKGGILLWVRTADKKKEHLAVQIVTGHSGRDVHAHGWSE